MAVFLHSTEEREQECTKEPAMKPVITPVITPLITPVITPVIPIDSKGLGRPGLPVSRTAFKQRGL